MNKIQEHLIYLDTMAIFSPRHQALMLMEECAELQQELSKFLREKPSPDRMAEELADVEIVMAQVKMHLESSHPGLFKCWKDRKMERLEKRLRTKDIEALK
jgi:NTP pyrophosphatase (non-canonical NTP hydrolase)